MNGTFKVQMCSTCGNVRKDLYTGLTEQEATDICEEYGWVYSETEGGYVWDLDVVEDDE